MICRQYPPRRDVLWNPGLYAQPSIRPLRYQTSDIASLRPATGVGRAPSPLSSLLRRLWHSEDARQFAQTFSIGFAGIMIFFG